MSDPLMCSTTGWRFFSLIFLAFLFDHIPPFFFFFFNVTSGLSFVCTVLNLLENM